MRGIRPNLNINFSEKTRWIPLNSVNSPPFSCVLAKLIELPTLISQQTKSGESTKTTEGVGSGVNSMGWGRSKIVLCYSRWQLNKQSNTANKWHVGY